MIAEGAAPSLHGALLASRQRWRDMVLLGADFTFETDRQGRFTMLEPDRVLGHPAATLLGRDASALTMGADPGPFSRTAAMRNQRTWVAATDGSARCLSISAIALKDETGGFAGLRGIARDVTAEAAQEAETEAAVRCLRHLPVLMDGGGSVSLRPLLDRLRNAMNAVGIALVSAGDSVPEVQAGGQPSPTVLAVLQPALETRSPLFAAGLRAEPVSLLPLPLEGTARGLALWRAPGAQGFSVAERSVLQAAAAHLATLVRLHTIERALESFSQTDPMTGLMTRHAFLGELNHRLERMAITGGSGVLLLADPGGLRTVNAERGSDTGDAVMRAVAMKLRMLVGASDMAVRLDDGAAVWLAGRETSAAEDHARSLCEWAEQGGVQPAGALHVGLATLSDGVVNAETLLGRAEEAMVIARTAGGTGWRLWKADTQP